VDFAHFEGLVRAAIRDDLRDIQPRVTVAQKPSGWAVVVLIPGVGIVGDRFLGGNAATHQDAARFVRLLVEEVRRMVGHKVP
jgi:hypothetical protein